MKSRIICVIIIAVFLVSVCSFSMLYTEHIADRVTEMTGKIYRDTENSKEKIEELSEKWEKYSELAALYIAHNEIEEVTTLISGLSESYNNSETIFRTDCIELMLTVEHINESQKPKFNNIF